jgi:hypothetical protein
MPYTAISTVCSHIISAAIDPGAEYSEPERHLFADGIDLANNGKRELVLLGGIHPWNNFP